MAADMPVDSFLDLLRQSGLVIDSQMLALAAEFSDDGAKWESARPVAAELVKRGVLTKWQADNLLQGKHRGFRLGPHRILMPLGKGGMSQVYLAEHVMMRRRCAIKVLPTKYQEDPDLLSRFHLEARAIAALDHPHIVRAYDFNKDVSQSGKETHYLVMEYVEGQDLRRMVEEQGPLDYRKAADFIRQAAEGLAHAHAAGFVHRDIKPANLLVDPNGVLKILDLGLALEGQEAWDTSERQQSAVGTADYVAPEQVMDSRNVDGRADIYSLGYTFYFLLTGRRPFPKSTLVELLMAHRVGEARADQQSSPRRAVRTDRNHRPNDRQESGPAIPIGNGRGRETPGVAARLGNPRLFAHLSPDGGRHASPAIRLRRPVDQTRIGGKASRTGIDDFSMMSPPRRPRPKASRTIAPKLQRLPRPKPGRSLASSA